MTGTEVEADEASISFLERRGCRGNTLHELTTFDMVAETVFPVNWQDATGADGFSYQLPVCGEAVYTGKMPAVKKPPQAVGWRFAEQILPGS